MADKAPTLYHVFVIKANGEVTETEQAKAPGLEQLQAAVGGYIETVPYFRKFRGYARGIAYANENGLMERLPLNSAATAAWAANGKGHSPLVGDVIFFSKSKG